MRYVSKKMLPTPGSTATEGWLKVCFCLFYCCWVCCKHDISLRTPSRVSVVVIITYFYLYLVVVLRCDAIFDRPSFNVLVRGDFVLNLRRLAMPPPGFGEAHCFCFKTWRAVTPPFFW